MNVPLKVMPFSKVGGLCQCAYIDEPILLVVASVEALLLLMVAYPLKSPSQKSTRIIKKTPVVNGRNIYAMA